MTEKHCIAFLANMQGAPKIDGVTFVTQGPFTAVLGPGAPKLRLTKKALLKAASQRMAVLEALMPHGTVLPTLSEVCFAESEAHTAIRANRQMLERAQHRLHGAIQFQLCIGWDDEQALSFFSQNTRVLPTSPDRDTLRSWFRGWVNDRLAPLNAEITALPTGPDWVINLAVLIPAQTRTMLDRCIEEIDALWTEGLTIRLIGPTPGVSFASLSMRRVSARQVKQACRQIGVQTGASVAEIKAARRAALLADRSGKSTDIAAGADLLTFLAEAGWPKGTIPRFALWAEGQAAPEKLQGAA